MRRFFLAALILLVPAIVPVSVSSRPLESANQLKWKQNTIRIAVSQSISIPNVNIKLGSDVVLAVTSAVKQWERAANISFEISYTDKLSVSPSGPAGDGMNLITIAQTPDNVLMFDKGGTDASARTRVFVDRRGYISEADIVLNPFQQFSTDGTLGTYDLQSVLTHELGHLLGLDHSSVFGSTMFEGLGHNGVYSLQNRFSRTLSPEDVAAVRALYGPPAGSEENCCGKLSGRISAPARFGRDLKVWVENAETAGLAAVADVGNDGTFQIGGLQAGKYRVLVQNSVTSKTQNVAQELSGVEIAKDKVTRLVETIKPQPLSWDLRYVGVGGQLGTLAVPLNRNRTYRILIGGTKLPDKFEVGSDSPFLEVDTSLIEPKEYNELTSFVEVAVHVRSDAPTGDYSLYIKTENGVKRYLVGSVTVETFEDLLALFINAAF